MNRTKECLCSICGNEIAAGTGICPYCGSSQKSESDKFQSKHSAKSVNRAKTRGTGRVKRSGKSKKIHKTGSSVGGGGNRDKDSTQFKAGKQNRKRTEREIGDQSRTGSGGKIGDHNKKKKPNRQGNRGPMGGYNSAGSQRDTGNQQIITVNLKSGMPTVEQALTRLDIKVTEARQLGIGLIRIIHGWGASGTGGRIKAALPTHLNELKRRRMIRKFVSGDQYSLSTRQGSELLSKYKVLKADLPSDRNNPGITFIEL